jgi:hypothetical protein
MKTIFAMVIAAPILALFIGVGSWAIRMADSWTPANTDVLIGGMVSACTTGGIVMALILSGLIALVFYSRFQQERYYVPPRWHREGYPTLPPPLTTWREVQPPMLTMNQPNGEWRSRGPEIYDVWQDEPKGSGNENQ